MRLKPATLYALWHTASAFALPVTPGRSRKGLSSRRHASTIGPEAPSNEKPGPKPPPLATIPPPTPSTPPSLSVPLICAVSALQSACFGVIGTALAPALAGSGLDPVRVAVVLGRIGSTSALLEVVLSGSLGRYSDRVGRKPLLLAAPLVTIIARSLVVLKPDVSVLVAARLVSSFAVPVYWLAFQASVADVYGGDATRYAVLGSRIQAAMGLGYAVASLVGGRLAARDVRLAYGASAFLGCCVLALVSSAPETRPASKITTTEKRPPAFQPLAFRRLFMRGPRFARLNAVVLLQSLTNGMGDLWQVLARELRQWGAAQCGRFAAAAGCASTLGTLLTGPSIRLFGPRGHTVATTGCAAASSALLGKATTDVAAYSALGPMALGAGRSHATSARIVNIGTSLGVPQGQLSAERNALNALIKVVAPTLYATLFTFGSKRGAIGLPFFVTSALLASSALLAATISYEEEN